MRYFLELSYKGTNYNGWQRQLNAPSVQQTLEEALSTILRSRTQVTGAGRTDTGVHAAYYVAHFDTQDEIPSPDDFIYHLNAVLPADIAAKRLIPVNDRAHARFDAQKREYKYYITSEKDPFRRETVWYNHAGLDMEAMNTAAQCLIGEADFTTFSKLHSNNKTNICEIYKAMWAREENTLVFTIAANRFLRNMVRSIVGTLADAGRGKITPQQFGDILRAQDRSRASGSAPAQGLFLTDVQYPEEIFLK